MTPPSSGDEVRWDDAALLHISAVPCVLLHVRPQAAQQVRATLHMHMSRRQVRWPSRSTTCTGTGLGAGTGRSTTFFSSFSCRPPQPPLKTRPKPSPKPPQISLGPTTLATPPLWTLKNPPLCQN